MRSAFFVWRSLVDTSYSDLIRGAQTRISDYLTPSVRLGVTGLSRAGKTIFITALVRNLLSGGRLPFFTPDADGRIVRAYLEPQPDDLVPRFDYERHLADLTSDPPHWPNSTRRVSELRITIEYRSASVVKRALGVSKLHLDIVDYPGEWLVDLPLMSQDYAAFANEAVALAQAPERRVAAKPWLDFLAGTDPGAIADEQIALTGAELFTTYLRAVRAGGAQATLAPGRFLLPGDLEGSPLLTFFPLPLTSGALSSSVTAPRGSLAAMMVRRYESYKAQVVRPFFRDHFARIDRQIVLVDVLGALDQGGSAVGELERALSGVLEAFRPGLNSWLELFTGRRIDRILYCATKADHIPASSHDRLSAILKRVIERASQRATREGADIETAAIAALRATRETTAKSGRETLPCLRGVPLAGERIGATVFDGLTEAAIFPGDLPADADAALANASASQPGSLALVSFRPPRISPDAGGIKPQALPHIRLDRALDYLLSDYLT